MRLDDVTIRPWRSNDRLLVEPLLRAYLAEQEGQEHATDGNVAALWTIGLQAAADAWPALLVEVLDNGSMPAIVSILLWCEAHPWPVPPAQPTCCALMSYTDRAFRHLNYRQACEDIAFRAVRARGVKLVAGLVRAENQRGLDHFAKIGGRLTHMLIAREP